MRQGLRFPRAELPSILAKRTDLLSPRMLRIIEGLSGTSRRLDERIKNLSDDQAAAKRTEGLDRRFTAPKSMAVHKLDARDWGRYADRTGYGSEPVRSRPGYRTTGFQSEGHRSSWLQPYELAQQGYPLDGDVTSPATVADCGPVSSADNG